MCLRDSQTYQARNSAHQNSVPEGEGLEKVARGSYQDRGGGSRGVRVSKPLEQAETAPKQHIM